MSMSSIWQQVSPVCWYIQWKQFFVLFKSVFVMKVKVNSIKLFGTLTCLTNFEVWYFVIKTVFWSIGSSGFVILSIWFKKTHSDWFKDCSFSQNRVRSLVRSLFSDFLSNVLPRTFYFKLVEEWVKIKITTSIW